MFHKSIKKLFINATKLKNITLPISITSISDFCFYECESLEIVLIKSNTLINIGISSFQNCYSLKSISNINSLTVIKLSALMNCYNLTEIQFPEDLTDIHDYSFFGCKSLFSIVLPKNLIKLGKLTLNQIVQLT